MKFTLTKSSEDAVRSRINLAFLENNVAALLLMWQEMFESQRAARLLRIN